jgi:hypothetical protein
MTANQASSAYYSTAQYAQKMQWTNTKNTWYLLQYLPFTYGPNL